MSFFRSTSEISATPAEAVPPVADPAVGGSVQHTSEILDEAILASSSRVRDSLPEQHREHFEALRDEIIDFAQAHNIPRESLAKPDALREAAEHLSIPDLERLATLLERFEYLLIHKEPREEISEIIEYAEKFYHLKKQYDSQVELLEEVGILESGTILGIDGYEYPIPTLEQIATRLFERRKELKTKHDQGFTKLLLVPFGMSLDSLREVLKQFLLSYKQNNPTFDLDTDKPLWAWEDYQGADTGDSPKLVYHPQSFTQDGHGGKTKMEILKEQAEGRWTPTSVGVAGEEGRTSPGWTIHLLQSSDPSNIDSPGFAPIPRQGKGTSQGDLTPRPPLEAGKTPNEHLSTLQKAQDDPTSSYLHESGLTPEDWIMAFMTHLEETQLPLDNWQNDIESIPYLTGAFFRSLNRVPFAHWNFNFNRINLERIPTGFRGANMGIRTSVIV